MLAELLLLGLAGLGVAAKDKQQFAARNQYAVRECGRQINEDFDEVGITNKYFWELKKYFDERYDYYMNDTDLLLNNGEYVQAIKDGHYEVDKLNQWYAATMAYEDMFKKYAPDYKELHKEMWGTIIEPDSYLSFDNIARALARIDAFKKGFCPAHINNMHCDPYGKKLYFWQGNGYILRNGSTDFNSINWKLEPLKYHTDSFSYCFRKNNGVIK